VAVSRAAAAFARFDSGADVKRIRVLPLRVRLRTTTGWGPPTDRCHHSDRARAWLLRGSPGNEGGRNPRSRSLLCQILLHNCEQRSLSAIWTRLQGIAFTTRSWDRYSVPVILENAPAMSSRDLQIPVIRFELKSVLRRDSMSRQLVLARPGRCSGDVLTIFPAIASMAFRKAACVA